MRSPSKLRDLDLNLLVLFDVMMSTGRLTDAAKQLSITQSAASQALGRLRRTFDDELFVRSRTGMAPTPVARELAPYVAEALDAVEKALRCTDVFEPTASTRTFRVAFGSTSEISGLPYLVAAVAARSRTLEVKSILATPAEALALAARAEIDLCFDYQAPTDVRLVHEHVRDEELVVIARKKHPRVRGTIPAGQFFAERHVVLALNAERRVLIERVLGRVGPKRDVLAEAAHYASVPSVVRRTDALALVPRSLADEAADRFPLQVFRPPFPVPTIPVFAIWHEALAKDPGHRWLRHEVLAALGP